MEYLLFSSVIRHAHDKQWTVQYSVIDFDANPPQRRVTVLRRRSAGRSM